MPMSSIATPETNPVEHVGMLELMPQLKSILTLTDEIELA